MAIFPRRFAIPRTLPNASARTALRAGPSEPPTIQYHASSARSISVRVRRHRQARRYTLRIHCGHARGGAHHAARAAALSRRTIFAQKHGGWIAARLGRLPEPAPFAPWRDDSLARRRLTASSTGHGQRGTVSDRERRRRDERLLCVAGAAPHVARRIIRLPASARLERDLEAGQHPRGRRRSASQSGAVSIRDPSSRWGSCSTTGVLSYSWRLISRRLRARLSRRPRGRPSGRNEPLAPLLASGRPHLPARPTRKVMARRARH